MEQQDSMSYEPEPVIQALLASAPPLLLQDRPDDVRRLIEIALLEHHDHRPYLWSEFVVERPDLIRPIAMVYDRPSGLVFTGGLAVHSKIAGQLYHFRQLGAESSRASELLRASGSDSATYMMMAEQFIGSGMGFMCGSVSAEMGRRTLLIGPEARFTAAERIIFREYTTSQLESDAATAPGDLQRRRHSFNP